MGQTATELPLGEMLGLHHPSGCSHPAPKCEMDSDLTQVSLGLGWDLGGGKRRWQSWGRRHPRLSVSSEFSLPQCDEGSL